MKKSLIFILSLMMLCGGLSACGRTTEDVYSSFPPSSEQPGNNSGEQSGNNNNQSGTQETTYTITYHLVGEDGEEITYDGDVCTWEDYGDRLKKNTGKYPTTAKKGTVEISDLREIVLRYEKVESASGDVVIEEVMTFEGWYINNDSTQEVTNNSLTLNGDIDLYARVSIVPWFGA